MIWRNLCDLDYNPVTLRSEFLDYHKTCIIPAKPTINLDIATDEYSLIKESFRLGDGLVFGERHFDNVSVSVLIDNMEYFASLGVDTFFFEGLFYGFERGIDGERDECDSVHPEYSALIESAKKNSIKIIGIDSKGCKRGDGITRDIFMNAHAASIIKGTAVKNKWIALVGMMHLENSEFIDSVTMQKYKVHGLANLTGAISVIPHAIENNEPKYIKHKQAFFALPAKRVTPDFIAGVYANKYEPDQLTFKGVANDLELLYQQIKCHGWKILHYDIDTYAKYYANLGHIKGCVFSLQNKKTSYQELLELKKNIEVVYSALQSNEASWCNVMVDRDKLICIFDIASSEIIIHSLSKILSNNIGT